MRVIKEFFFYLRFRLLDVCSMLFQSLFFNLCIHQSFPPFARVYLAYSERLIDPQYSMCSVLRVSVSIEENSYIRVESIYTSSMFTSTDILLVLSCISKAYKWARRIWSFQHCPTLDCKAISSNVVCDERAMMEYKEYERYKNRVCIDDGGIRCDADGGYIDKKVTLNSIIVIIRQQNLYCCSIFVRISVKIKWKKSHRISSPNWNSIQKNQLLVFEFRFDVCLTVRRRELKKIPRFMKLFKTYFYNVEVRMNFYQSLSWMKLWVESIWATLRYPNLYSILWYWRS